MDGQLAQQTNPLTFPKLVFIFFGVLALGFILGFSARPFISPQKLTPPLSNKPAIDESKLPISLALLTNPVVYEWRGGVKGKMTRKDADSFTLVDDQGNSITITDITAAGSKSKIHFFDASDKTNKEASYSAIPVGSTLLGDFFIFKNGPNIPVGSSFVKQ